LLRAIAPSEDLRLGKPDAIVVRGIAFDENSEFWPSICPERCAHMDKNHSEGGYPANFGILSAIIFHMRLPWIVVRHYLTLRTIMV